MSGNKTFAEATQLQQLDEKTFRANLDKSFCTGTVPNGGYSSSCMLSAARSYLSSRDQKDNLTSHFDFLARTEAGPAIITVEELRIGKQKSTLQVSLWQGDGILAKAPWVNPSKALRAITASMTQINLADAQGLSVPTGFAVRDEEARPAKPNLKDLLDNGIDKDRTWIESKIPKGAEAIMHTLKNWRMFIPRKGALTPGVLDMWMCLSSGEPITQSVLPYAVDTFPFNMHLFLASPDILALMFGPKAKEEDSEVKEKRETAKKQNESRGELWMPTVVMNIETKELLPEEGVKWVNMRATAKQIKNGFFDMEVVIRDEDEELIMLSQHVAMVVSMARNTGSKPKAAL